MSESRSVDLSHLQCPYTLIQLSQAIRDLGENANLRIKIRSDQLEEIQEWCNGAGLSFEVSTDRSGYVLTIA